MQAAKSEQFIEATDDRNGYIIESAPGHPGLLALGIPSMTVRTAIMTPIAWALCQSLGLKPKSNGTALIILTTVEMAVVPGLAFMLGSLAGPVVVKAFAAKNLPLTWGGPEKANVRWKVPVDFGHSSPKIGRAHV